MLKVQQSLTFVVTDLVDVASFVVPLLSRHCLDFLHPAPVASCLPENTRSEFLVLSLMTDVGWRDWIMSREKQ